MSEFHFLRPLWLLALLPGLLLIWQIKRIEISQSGWQRFLPPHLANHLLQGNSTVQRHPLWLFAICWLLATILLSGPTWQKRPQPVFQSNSGKVILLDMSLSMRSTDIAPDRLTKARYKTMDLVKHIQDADLGLIAWAGDAFVISPLTSDVNNINTLIPSLSPEIMPEPGSAPLVAVYKADELLKNAGYTDGDIYLITDGLDHEDVSDLQAFFKKSAHKLSILGVGTADGAPIKQINGEFVKDRTGAIVIPKMNSQQLNQLARSTGGVYSSLTHDDADIRKLVSGRTVTREAKKDEELNLEGDQWEESAAILLLLLVPLASLAFRRGVLIAALLSFTLLSPNEAKADWWQDLWQNGNQQGTTSFSNAEFSAAAEQFTDEQWKGSSYYKAGDYDAALHEFKKANDATGLYNQGNAHAKLGQMDDAINAYEKSLALNPDNEDAQKNLELLKQLRDQQQDQQQNQQQDGEGDDQDNQQQQGDQQNQDQQEQSSSSDEQSGEQNQQEQQQSDNDNQQQNENQSEPSDKSSEQQADKQPQNEEQESQDNQAEQQQAEQEQSEQEQTEQEQQQATASEQPLTKEELEKQQEIQQILRRINDDPALLLRNKMILEHRKRQQESSPTGVTKTW